jgi:8-amino-7-oxononanoate synthase
MNFRKAMDFAQFLSVELKKIEEAGLRRHLRRLESPQGPEVVCDGVRLVNFSSNDYLGLAGHPRLRAEALRVLEAVGTGAGASRLICGNHDEHERLEEALARFKRAEAALSFSTGYAAAVGVIPTIVGTGDVVILDKLSHASLVDGARLSGATLRVFPHNNLDKLADHLRWARDKHASARILVVVESVYSMDGDVAPLREIVDLKDRHGAWLMVDEAHGVGVLGPSGRGLAESLGVADRIEIQMGTLGKALGSSGAYVCGRGVLRDYLINRARSFIFSTAPSPATAAASRAAVEILDSPEGAALMGRLWENIRTLAEDLPGSPPQSAIRPVVIGGEQEAVAVSLQLREAGFLVPAIRYPTVARGSARLRIALSAVHERRHIRRLAEILREVQGAPGTLTGTEGTPPAG